MEYFKDHQKRWGNLIVAAKKLCRNFELSSKATDIRDDAVIWVTEVLLFMIFKFAETFILFFNII